ncbi:hypothetical protein KKI93_18165, partial [Xenorhabdus bovienii]|nr:hypothetical protein [Xenorhabdus bovienii]MDE9565929.1 hypothetical protein [Xenorhabdus bovienii]
MVIKNKKTLLATLAVSGVMYGSLAYADSHKGVHRNGRSRSGHQRYLCQSCRHSWQREFTYA